MDADGTAGAPGRDDRGASRAPTRSLRASAISAGRADCGTWSRRRCSISKRLNLLDANGKFCGTGANYDLIKAELAQFRLSHNTVNPTAQANRVVGVVDPAVGLGPPSPCFEGMAVVNSQEAWALALPGKAGQLLGLEIAHTLGLTPPSRESPFDGAHSQNVAAENPSLNRRYNVVQRGFIVTDRSLMKPSATSPSPNNDNTLLEVPDYSFLHCVFGGPAELRVPDVRPGHGERDRARRRVALVRHVRHDDERQPGRPLPDRDGCAARDERRRVVLRVERAADRAEPDERVSARPAGRAAVRVLSNLGVPVTSGTRSTAPAARAPTHSSGLFSVRAAVRPERNRSSSGKARRAPPARSSSMRATAPRRRS